ncbi:MAG: hypothetical protein U1E50_18855 [Caulobacteraceae bacterium]
MASAAFDRFIASMIIDQDMWRDGTGYDLAALDELPSEELKAIEALLITRKDEDWRDTEALAHIGTAAAKAALKASTAGPNHQVRLTAAQALQAAGEPHELEQQIVDALESSELYGGLAQAERLAEDYPTEAVKSALLRGALTSTDGRAVRFVALLYFFHGLGKEPFDWDQRPYFLEFLTEDKAERRRLVEALRVKLKMPASALEGL